MNKELKAMNSKELEKLLVDVKKELQLTKARDRRKALKAAERAAAEFGFNLNELREDAPVEKKKPKSPKKAAKPSKPKYANPADPSRTWTGKGRQPLWFLAAVEKGINPTDMEI